MKTRIKFLDNLRTIMILLVVVLHAGIVYEPILENTWIVSDPVKNSSIGLIRMYLDIFVMFIIFFISGYFVPISLKSKTNWSFIKAKFNRIMIPWIVSVLTIIPLYKVIFLYSRGLPQEEWYSYFHIFQRTGTDLSFFANNPTQSWLWFLPVIFVFQVIYLMMNKAGLFKINISLKTAVILTLVTGIAYSLIISAINLRGWYHSPLFHFQRERLLIYFMVFLLGSLCFKLRVFESDVKNKKQYIWSNVVLSVSMTVFTVVAMNLFFNMIDPARNYFFVSLWVDRAIYYTSLLLTMMSFLYIFVYVFRFNLNKSNRIMNELNKNSYAVYIIHLIVIGGVALLLLNINIPAFVKLLVVIILSYSISNGIVSAYRALFQKYFSSNGLRIATVAAGVFVSIIIYAKQENGPAQSLPASTMQEEVSAPKTSLHMAVIEGNLEAVKQHIKAGSDLNVVEPSGGSSPLITAAVFGKTEEAMALIKAGADVNFQNKEGSTPLHTAAFFCRTDIVEFLLQNGADASIRNNAGSTALESVTAPFEVVNGIYDYFQNTLGPLGLVLDYQEIKSTRPKIALMLEKNSVK